MCVTEPAVGDGRRGDIGLPGRGWPGRGVNLGVVWSATPSCPMTYLDMVSLWNRIPVWADWLAALVAAIVVFNVNVTTSGDPLSGVGLSAGPTSAGITEGARATFYGVLAIGALLLTAAGLRSRRAIEGADRLEGF